MSSAGAPVLLFLKRNILLKIKFVLNLLLTFKLKKLGCRWNFKKNPFEKGHAWFTFEKGHAWVTFEKGHAWFKFEKGNAWFTFEKGNAWFTFEKGHAWFTTVTFGSFIRPKLWIISPFTILKKVFNFQREDNGYMIYHQVTL